MSRLTEDLVISVPVWAFLLYFGLGIYMTAWAFYHLLKPVALWLWRRRPRKRQRRPQVRPNGRHSAKSRAVDRR